MSIRGQSLLSVEGVEALSPECLRGWAVTLLVYRRLTPQKVVVVLVAMSFCRGNKGGYNNTTKNWTQYRKKTYSSSKSDSTVDSK